MLTCQAPGTTGGLHTGLDDVGVLELREREATLGHRAELVGRMREDAARPEPVGRTCSDGQEQMPEGGGQSSQGI